MSITGLRVGFGFDVHRLSPSAGLRLCGVDIAGAPGLEGTSDADVVLHAVIDAVLGAAALGDIGELFPPSDPATQDADSRNLVAITLSSLAGAGYVVRNVDVTIVSESVCISPHREKMKTVLAELLNIGAAAVSVKATSTDGLGLVGREEGLAAMAVVAVEPSIQE